MKNGLNELASIDGVVIAFEYSADGKLVDYAVKQDIPREKQDGTFRRLLVAPLPRAALLIGKLLPYFIVNLIQVALMFAVGVVVFRLSLGNDPLALVVVTAAASAAATGLGLLIAALGKTPEQIGGLSSLLVVTLAALGGVMVPTFVMPPFMQTIGKISPHYWALAGYEDVIVRGAGPARGAARSRGVAGLRCGLLCRRRAAL